MIKQFSAGDITVRPFKTFKHWSVQSVHLGHKDAYGFNTYYDNLCEVNEGIKNTSIFYPSGSSYYTASVELINPSGKYARNIYSLTDSMFYRNKKNFMELFGVESVVTDTATGKKEVRNIHDRVVTLALNQTNFGEKIRPETVEIVDNSNPHATYIIKDDGYTNLYITGSHFSEYTYLSAMRNIYPRPYWNTSSGEFHLNLLDGESKHIDVDTAKEYLKLGMNVSYTGTSDYLYDSSSLVDTFQSDNEHFGEAVSSWYKYVVAGSSIDKYNLNTGSQGYAAIFKYDDNLGIHRPIKKFTSPLRDVGFLQDFDIDKTFPYTVENLQNSGSYFTDTFGQSVSVRDNFLAVGSSSGSICFPTGSYPGYVFVYDKYKGGTDNWGLINIIQGNSNGDNFGKSVSLDRDTLAIGAPGVSGSGAVYIFRRKQYMSSGCDAIETSSFWQTLSPETDLCDEIISESGSLIIYSERPIPWTYSSMAYTSSSIELLSGSMSASYDPNSTDTRRVSSSYYRVENGAWSGSYSWEYEAILTSSVLSLGDNFGWCVALDSGSLFVGTNKTGNGYATLFTCSYYSSSVGDCPTASWGEAKTFRRDGTYGDLDMSSQFYSIDVTGVSISDDGFGTSVAIGGKNLVIGCLRDKAFIPYASYTGSPTILGSAYFYRNDYRCGSLGYWQVLKTFGDRKYQYNNNFGKSVSLGGLYSAITSWSDKVGRNVDYFDGEYIIDDLLYQASSSDDPNGVLGRVAIYKYSDVNETWQLTETIRRNKEANKPSNIYGYSVCLCSDFMVVGAPVVHFATASATASVYDPNNLVDFPANCSGSVYVYNVTNLEDNPLIGNVFYKNGYFALTHTGSNYRDIFTKTGSGGFDLTYQGSHTIYEHEYLTSIRPGEFNYSTNPTSLVKTPLMFDVNQDGVFDFLDVDLIMRFFQKRKFFEEFIFDDNGVVLEQNSNADNSWWGDDLLQLESEDVLLQEQTGSAAYIASSSFNAFTKTAYDYIQSNLVDTELLDIDGDGKINMNDANILALYYLERLVPQNLIPLLSPASTRKYVRDINDYLNPYCHTDIHKVNPHFLEYEYSSSYDPTGSYLAPFITTVGLYDGNELVAVGKLGRPVKNLIDWPVNIIVRFDT